MINVLPQVDKMNRGAWLETEMIIECLRDVEALTILGGAIYPAASEKGKGTTAAEFFRESHGVVTPTHFWKIIASDKNGLYKKDNGLIAFWMPNSEEAVAKKTSDYIVSISELEEKLKDAYEKDKTSKAGWPESSLPEIFDLPKSVKDHVPSFWKPLEGCDRA
jgi:DNA/RNA endonuclease G (NUC1)